MDFNLQQLIKEMVVTRLKALDEPCAAAVEIAKKTLVIILKENTSLEFSKRQIEESCHGTMVGLLLAEQNLPKAAVLLLEMTGELATQLNLDPMEIMRSALEGIAHIRKLQTHQQIADIQKAISRNFMGAGEAFAALLAQEPSEQSVRN